jgi:hypothetical protein
MHLCNVFKKKNLMKNSFVILLFLIAFVLNAKKSLSQDESPVQFGADLMSRYIWRGLDAGGDSPSLQPFMLLNLSSNDTTHTFELGT